MARRLAEIPKLDYGTDVRFFGRPPKGLDSGRTPAKRHESRFDRELRRLVAEQLNPGTPIDRLDDDTLRIGDVVIGLANLRTAWEGMPASRRRAWLRSMIPDLIKPPRLPRSLTDTGPLRPGIRPRSILEAARLTNLGGQIDPDRWYR